MINGLIFQQAFVLIKQMVTFTNDSVSRNEDLTDFKALGDLSIGDLGMSIPYHGLHSDYTN